MAITTSVKPKLKLTYEDYARLPDDERCELIDGELIPMPSPKEIHQNILKLMTLRFFSVEARGLGTFYFAPFDVILSATNVVQPDLIFVSSARSHIITEDNIRGAPDLARRNHLAVHGTGYDRIDQAKPVRPPRRRGILAG